MRGREREREREKERERKKEKKREKVRRQTKKYKCRHTIWRCTVITEKCWKRPIRVIDRKKSGIHRATEKQGINTSRHWETQRHEVRNSRQKDILN
jgi:hypothetical protein